MSLSHQSPCTVFEHTDVLQILHRLTFWGCIAIKICCFFHKNWSCRVCFEENWKGIWYKIQNNSWTWNRWLEVLTVSVMNLFNTNVMSVCVRSYWWRTLDASTSTVFVSSSRVRPAHSESNLTSLLFVSWVEFNMALETLQVIAEIIFPANHSTQPCQPITGLILTKTQ